MEAGFPCLAMSHKDVRWHSIKIWKNGLCLMSPKTSGDKKQYKQVVLFG